MPGIYIHIPFCKQACNYCDFYFTTRKSRIENFVQALLIEIELQQAFFPEGTLIDSLYFGGGTPSLLSAHELEKIFSALYNHFKFNTDAEITLEANPDDLDTEKIQAWVHLGINRLSLGIQSLSEQDLKFMHRAHTATEAKQAVQKARAGGIQVLTLDLMYGIPQSGNKQWEKNLEYILSTEVQHFSAYALTVEKGTRLANEIQRGKTIAPSEEESIQQFDMLLDFAEKHNFEAYEISNYAKPGYRAKHNSAYWHQEAYLGLGPSAHSYSGTTRSMNLPDMETYIQELTLKNTYPPAQTEVLSKENIINEYIMTRLRLIEGISLLDYQNQFLHPLELRAEKIIQEYQNKECIRLESGILKLTKKGKLYSDQIAMELFI